MNHYAARQASDGRWRYTCENDGRVWPIGYCGRWMACTTCEGTLVDINGASPDVCPACGGRGAVEVPDDQRCPGHDTAAAAREHYRLYLIERCCRLDAGSTDAPCVVCYQPARAFALVGGDPYDLCDEHRTLEVLGRIVPDPGSSWSSW